ncbi:MAG TPA: hypothetical protein VK903_03490, partial [Propionicimonas sp.]|nr:hypothetical protein [Propionicimonas sp.]
MTARWHRVVSGLGLALAGALLTGCHAQGTFDVLSEERVAVDLIVSGADVNCPNSADALKLTVTSTVDQYGDEVCHVTGETQATYFSPFGITVSPAAEYLVLQANLSGGLDSWPTADIDIRFPGKVMDATRGEIVDNVVRITDLGELTQGSGLHAVGLSSAGPPAWTLAALVGGGVGIALTLVVGAAVLLVRRSRRHRLTELEELPFTDDAVASDAGPAPPVAAAFEPVPAASTGPPSPLPEDTSWFARPPTDTGATNGAPLANGTGVDGTGVSGKVPNEPASTQSVQPVAWARPPDTEPSTAGRA